MLFNIIPIVSLSNTATALASSVGSLYGSGKMKSLERRNEDLQDRTFHLLHQTG